ncbi:MAG TPA: HEAT repeat domain-containing protein, partial [Gemmataceae bacterium]
MRLTLRTLLAYLDDTLDPAEIKQIGMKVAESDAAQELIARIKQVTRRRRLTTPPATGPGAKFDPNTIAEYLDNLLPAEQVAEVEKTCLESDVHLAEIAACHQILTLVLGEPALVPPTAKERMYGLVQGREAQPRRRAAVAGATNGLAAAEARTDADETLLLGLPMYHRQSKWMRWLLPVALVGMLLVIAIALWQVLRPGPGKTPVAQGDQNKETNQTPPPSTETKKETSAAKDDANKKDDANGGKKDDANSGKKDDTDSGKKDDGNPQRPALPGDQIRELGAYDAKAGAVPSVLLQRSRDQEPWQRLRPDSVVSSTDTLMSPPGFSSEVHLASGVHVQLLGSVPEFLNMPLLESAVVLHADDKFDLDLTLERGRIVIANFKDQAPARCRIRFHSEVWDFTLEEPSTEIGLFLIGRHLGSFESGLNPHAEMFLCVLKGRASAAIGHEEHSQLHPAPGAALFTWENEGKGARGPLSLQKPLPYWDKTLPENAAAQEMRRAIDELQSSLALKSTVESVLLKSLRSERPSHRLLAVRFLGAIDALPKLLDALGDEDAAHADVRLEAIAVLRHWLGRNGEQDKKLYDKKAGTGALIDKRYKPSQAEIIMQLLHYLSDEQRQDPETYQTLIDYLSLNQLVIRELAYWHLARLAQEGQKFNYNAAAPTDDRKAAIDKWKKFIPEG